MRNVYQIELLVMAGTALAGWELCMTHISFASLWPLWLLGSSIYRILLLRLETGSLRSAFQLLPLGLLALGLAVELSTRRRRPRQEESALAKGGGHE